MIVGAGKIVRFWHPSKGGWYVGQIKKVGRKWITLNYAVLNKIVRVPVADVAELPK